MKNSRIFFWADLSSLTVAFIAIPMGLANDNLAATLCGIIFMLISLRMQIESVYWKIKEDTP
jgi:hypothetical protein